MTATKAIWLSGDLIASESLQKRFQTDTDYWGKLVCHVLGNALPQQLSEVSSNNTIKELIAKHIKACNENYQKILRGEAIKPPSQSVFSISAPKEASDFLLKQIIQTQELPWIKAALVPRTQVNIKNLLEITEQQKQCVELLYTLLEESKSLQIENKKLSSLKSFLAAQIGLYEYKDNKTIPLTWDKALALWVKKSEIDKTTLAIRVECLSQKLKTISCLEVINDESKTTFESFITPQPCTTFRLFVAQSSCDYIASSLGIPKDLISILPTIFEKYELTRVLILYYCQTLDALKSSAKKPSEFLQATHIAHLKKLLVDDFFTLCKIARPFDIESKTIAEYYEKVAPSFENNVFRDPTDFLSLLRDFYTLEKFCESAHLLAATDLHVAKESGLTTRDTPKWHPFTLFFFANGATRQKCKEDFSNWDNIALAAKILQQIETSDTEIPAENKLDFAVRYHQKYKEGIDISLSYQSLSDFSQRFSTKAPLERLKYLLDCNTSTTPLFSKYVVLKNGEISIPESLYIEATRCAGIDKDFIPCLEAVLQVLRCTLTFDEILLIGRWGPQKSISLKNSTPFIFDIPAICEKLKKYQFSDYQKVLISIRYIYSKLQPNNLIADIEKHIEMLTSLEKHLRLVLPQEIAFSWLVYREMKTQDFDVLLTTLSNIHNYQPLNVDGFSAIERVILCVLSGHTQLEPIPGTSPLYKTIIQQFLINTYCESESAPYYPKALPLPRQPSLEGIFSSAAPVINQHLLYPSYHRACVSFWNASSTSRFYEYSLFIIKNPDCLETYSSSFSLQIPKNTLAELSFKDEFKYTFLRKLLDFFLSNMIPLLKYEKEVLTKNDALKYSTIINNLQNYPKLTKDPVMKQALFQYSLSTYQSECQALFSFAFDLHHFVGKTALRFSKPSTDAITPTSFLELASLGNIYDRGESLSLLPVSSKEPFGVLESCFLTSKATISGDLKNGSFTRNEDFYTKTAIVKKEMNFECTTSKRFFKVTISIKDHPLSLSLKYPLRTFLSVENLRHLIAWQMLLVKSSFYKSLSTDDALSNNFKTLEIQE